MNIIIENLNSYFADMYGEYGEIDEEVRNMVKSFYDPKIKEEGIKEEQEKNRLKNLGIVHKLLTKRFGNLSEEIKGKLNKSSDNNLGLIIENILDFEKLEDAVNYLDN